MINFLHNLILALNFRTDDRISAHDFCGESYQCQYDYAMTLNRDFAHFTKNYYDSYTQIRASNAKRSKFCCYHMVLANKWVMGEKNNFCI